MTRQSTVVSRLSEEQLFKRWSNRWSHFLDDFSASTSSETVSELLRDKVKSGNAERAIAGGHEGREILELLQNARDAIPNQTDGGRVYVGVYDEGVLVANTGDPFDLFDPDVEDAVTMIGESSKGNSDQEIGHKGVGLKSVLATGDAFEIWTRHNAATDGTLRVRLSRAYVTAALLSSLGYDTSSFGLQGTVPNETIQSLTSQSNLEQRTETLDLDAREDIGKLPLFDFPVPLTTTTDQSDPVANRASSLLAGEGDEWYGDPFRTAVFIEYEDDDWRSLLDSFDLPSPESNDRDAEERADRLWSYLSKNADEEGLTPETLVQFGGIDTLLLERVEKTGDTDRERWDVNRSSGSLDSERVQHERVTVTIQGTKEALPDKRFDQFEYDDPDTHTQLLVPRTTGQRGGQQKYPLYLYYPIENTRDVSLPFCLHGHFTVETNRKDLSLNSLEENRKVLERGVELIGRVAAVAAESDFGERYPWILLPPSPEHHPDEPSSQASLLTWFRAAIYEELRERACLPTVGDADSERIAVLPEEALIHWNATVRDGFLALYDVLDSIDTTVTDTAIDRNFPTRETLQGCRSFSDTWETRIESLLSVDNTDTFSAQVAQSWAAILGDHLNQQVFDEEDTHLVCNAETAQSLFIGTIETILRSGTEDDELSSTLDAVSSHLEGVYLLPCRRTNSEETVGEDGGETANSEGQPEKLLLVPIESRSGPTPNERGTSRSRSVLWDVNSPERDIEPPEVPREKSSFRVYFLDRTIEQNERARRVLELAGRPWGVRVYDGTPSYFRELLDTFATDQPTRVEALDFYFLAKQIDKLGSESPDLQTDEGSFIPINYVKTAVARSDGDQRQNLRRRLNLRNNFIALPREGGLHEVGETILGDEWQRVRARAHENDTVDDWDAFDGSASSRWPEPDEETWEPIVGALQDDAAYERIAQTLSLFGASVLPGIQTVWMYGSGHPRTRGDASWDPSKWSSDDFAVGKSLPDSAVALQQTLAELDGTYQRWITAPGRHPQTTAEHSSKCNVKTDGILEDVFLATWVWMEDLDALSQLGEDDLLELLGRYENKFSESILETGWTCSHGHQRDGYEWSKTVPTLLNWQLRHLSVWDSTVSVDPDLQERWGDDANRLAYTVVKTGSRGAQASRLFPNVEVDDLDLSEELLRTLGVKPVESFDAVEAAHHLQRLLKVLAVDSLGEEPVPLNVPDERDNDWNAAYTALLDPILRHIPAEDADVADIDLPFLSHLPIQRDGKWQVASLDWMAENAETGRYYEDQSPKPWERRAVEEGDHWLLARTASGPFTRLAAALGVERVDASKPVFDADDLTFTDTSLSEFRSELRERTVLLVASLEQTSEDRIREFADDLEAAISELRVAERFPENVESGLENPKSGLYAPREGEEAFVFNASAYDEELSLDGLANAVSLLAERPTTIATFREALDNELSTVELTKRWRRRTFPVDEVTRILGAKRRRNLRQRLDALVSLVERFDGEVRPAVDEIVETVERDDDSTVEDFEQALIGNEEIDVELDKASIQSAFISDIRDNLPSDVQFVLGCLFGEDRRSWSEAIAESNIAEEKEQIVITWLAENATATDATSCFPQSVPSAYVRLLAVRDVWDQTETEELQDPDEWRSRIQELSTNRSVEWTNQLSDRLRADDTRGDRLFFYTPIEKLQSAVIEPFLEEICETVAEDALDLKTVLRQYVLEGEFPMDETAVSAADHQDNALAELQSAAERGQEFSTENLLDEDFGVQSASTRVTGSGRGGGSTQYRGRGQQGEAATLVAILDDAASWLEDQPIGTMRSIRSTFRRLSDDQQREDYDWHLNRVWEQNLLPLLSSGELTRESIVDWREYLEDGHELSDHPLVQLCNVTLEQGPGFDIIDPFGPLSSRRGDFDLDQFVPVEVKAVDGRSPPFHFRLTTNEYRRCKAFLRGGRSYVIRLVYVPDPGTPNWASETQFVSEIVLEDVEDAESVVRGDPFEEVVKGGYMNMSIDS
ncbi:sacsin N-terminal ATP-binding-like domain-containing protein [Salinilacihabitans rarus]|uniref:sacsin N-terminal ATP-binding-like domain-containing protein n=1 Tax=Salinilacihabitans rarus TaxID=2961596 RepID=UPI0020C87DDB|nr:hypothetical protein [Salinilacihabitans rarus]